MPNTLASTTSSATRYGCHCDLFDGETPDGCVLDENRPEDCVHARRFKKKESCEYWQPIKLVNVDAGAHTPLAIKNLKDAAQAVVDQWDTPNWKMREPTAKLIEALRRALKDAE